MKLYEAPQGEYTRWFSFENPKGEKGRAAMSNHGHKGAAARDIKPGESVILLEAEGPGIIQHMWMVYDSQVHAKRLRTMRLEIYWDGADTPAVSAPMDEFFCHPVWAGEKPFENALFSSPQGRSHNCFIPMPFQKKAKVVAINDSTDMNASFYYCIEATFGMKLPENTLYFHTIYQPERKTTLGEDFEILPKVSGIGRYLGTNVQVRDGEGNAGTWFGEGEVKIYLDGDEEYPTLSGTGTEDYILCAYGQPEYSHAYSGCTVYNENKETNELTTAFYRLHIPDPVYFYEDCRVTIQQMRGGFLTNVRKVLHTDAKIKPVNGSTYTGKIYNEDNINIDDPDIIYLCFLSEDYVSSVAYFYLNRPVL